MARTRILVLAFAASAAVVLLLSSALVFAEGSDSDGDGVPDSIEQATQRSVATSSAGDEINISSRLVSAPYEDEFGVSFKAGTFSVWYDRPGSGGSGYSLELQSLVEWLDGDRNGRIDTGEVVASMPLGRAAFGGITIVHTNVSNPDGGRVHFFRITSNDGAVTLNLTVAQRFMRLSSDRVLTPMEVKLDITINHVFVRPDVFVGPGAAIGLEMHVSTEERAGYSNVSWDDLNGFAKDDGALTITGGPSDRPTTVFFSWAKNAFADGRQVPVAFSNPASIGLNGSFDTYMTYPFVTTQPQVKIVHDPTLGVESAAYHDIVTRPPELQGDVALYAGTLAVMAVLLALTIVVAKRRRKKREE